MWNCSNLLLLLEIFMTRQIGSGQFLHFIGSFFCTDDVEESSNNNQKHSFHCFARSNWNIDTTYYDAVICNQLHFSTQNNQQQWNRDLYCTLITVEAMWWIQLTGVWSVTSYQDRKRSLGNRDHTSKLHSGSKGLHSYTSTRLNVTLYPALSSVWPFRGHNRRCIPRWKKQYSLMCASAVSSTFI